MAKASSRMQRTVYSLRYEVEPKIHRVSLLWTPMNRIRDSSRSTHGFLVCLDGTTSHHRSSCYLAIPATALHSGRPRYFLHGNARGALRSTIDAVRVIASNASNAYNAIFGIEEHLWPRLPYEISTNDSKAGCGSAPPLAAGRWRKRRARSCARC